MKVEAFKADPGYTDPDKKKKERSKPSKKTSKPQGVGGHRVKKEKESASRTPQRAGGARAKEGSVSRCSSPGRSRRGSQTSLRLVPRPVVPRGSVALALRKRPAAAAGLSSSTESESARWMEKRWPDVWHDLDGAEWHLDALVWDGGFVRETWKRWHPEE